MMRSQGLLDADGLVKWYESHVKIVGIVLSDSLAVC